MTNLNCTIYIKGHMTSIAMLNAIIIKRNLSLFLVLIAEVTQPSLGVGYEIGRAMERGKPILCLFRPSSGRGLSLKLTI